MNGLKTSLKIGLQILELLSHSEDHPTSVREMAVELHQSEKYLEQLLLPMRHSRLVRSLRGPHGGYLLGRSPAYITLLDVARQLQGAITFCDCASHDCGECVSPAIWQALEDCLEMSMTSVTLADIVNRQPHDLPKHLALGASWVENGLGI